MELHATITETGAMTVTMGADHEELAEQHENVAAARRALVKLSSEVAGSTGEPTRAVTLDPSGMHVLTVSADGQVSNAPAPATEETPARLAPAEELASTAAAAPDEVAPVDVEEAAPQDVEESVPAQAEEAAAAAEAAAPAAEKPVGGNPFLVAKTPVPPTPGQPEGPATAPVSAPPVESLSAAGAAEQTPNFLQNNSPVTPDPAEQGWQGWLNRVFGLKVGPSESELRQRAAVDALSRHWIGSRTVAVLNSKGGANKTPTVIRLASELARAGGGGVLAWDNNESLGTLGWRTHSGEHSATVLDLITAAPEFLKAGASKADLAAFVHHQPEDAFDVLRSDERPEHDHRITGAEVDLLHEVASRNWRLIIMDSGNSTRGENFTRMIDHTDQVVIATTSESDKAQGAVNSLQALHARGGHAAQLARNAVVIVSEVHPQHSLKAQEIVGEFAPIVRSAHIVPFDQALVQGRMRAQDLSGPTRRAWQLAAAAVIAEF